ncbi:TniQ family protein [Paenibacillus glycanilyticus]|uniref:TniQ family protein n=1 Tax=Paenibacillus glycanilyticus TaxID=126569 RepID=UPI00204126B8|nr:TniQ family protein [Paenibacillus glycanilyticus]MCM3625779.1 TniQ family protein [Paenibacillus glycanilyticus]
MNYVWRKEWIKAYETPWSIFEKLAFSNRVERNDILRFFGGNDVKKIKNPNIGDSRRELIQLSGFNTDLLNNVLNFDLIGNCQQSINSLIEPFKNFHEPLDQWFPKVLHWCPACLSKGYHSWFHQFILIKNCPFHGTVLHDCCPKCGGHIPFLLSDKGLSYPFTCVCGYSLSSSICSEWKVVWGEPVGDIQDSTVKALVSRAARTNSQSQWLFMLQHMTINLIAEECQHRAFVRSVENKESEQWGDSKRLQLEFNHRNKEVFKAVERFIRKKMLKNHRHCINALQCLLKAEGEDFPPICPYAYAYVFWRTTVLKSKNFYSIPWGDDIDEKNGIATQIISDKLSYLRSRFWSHTSGEYRTHNTRLIQLYWIMDKITAKFCFNFFRQWLHQAGKGVSDVKVPSWQHIDKMVDSSFPLMAFKYSIVPSDNNLIECYCMPETTKNIRYECPFLTKASIQALREMKSHSPQAVAMKIYDNPNEQNKELQRNVEKYVRNLMT